VRARLRTVSLAWVVVTKPETAPHPAKRRATSAGPTPPRKPAQALRRHALFPRAPSSGPEDRDIRWIGIWRKLPPEEQQPGRTIERCARDYPADEILNWASIYERFGGGAYRVCAKDRKHRIICWASDGDDKWHFMSGCSYPLSDADDEDDAPIARLARPAMASAAPLAPAVPPAPTPAAPPTPAPTATPAMDAVALMQMMMRMQRETADRQMEMMMKMSEGTTALVLAVLSRREHHGAAAPPAHDPLEAVRLGVELAQRATAQTPAPAPTTAPIAYQRATIALMKEMGMLTPPPARSAASDVAEVQTVFNDLLAKVKAGSAMDAAAPVQASQHPAVVVIGGRCLTVDAAAAEYALLAGGQSVEAPVSITPEAVAPEAPPSPAASVVAPRSDDGDTAVAGACTSVVFGAGLTELIASSLRSTADAPEAEAPSSGGTLSRADTTAVPAGESVPANDARETSVVPEEPRAHDRGDDHAPTEQPRNAEPEPMRPSASPAPADGADDQAVVERFLRGDPAALAWLRAAVGTDARAPLPEQPADLGYFAAAVDLIREHAEGRAMLRAAVARAEHRPQADAPTVHEATQGPASSASTPEARPPRGWSRSDADARTINSGFCEPDATSTPPRTSDAAKAGIGEAFAA
jgi:hypothetical protein